MDTRIGRRRRTALFATLLLALGCLLLASSASAAPPAYNLTGEWKSGYLTSAGTRAAANGTQTVTSMNMTTGVFSGTSVVEGTHFVLNGKESGKELEFTQSEGGYSSHDKVPALSILPDGHVGGNGAFEGGNFWIEVTKPAAPTKPTEEPKEKTEEEATPGAFVTVLCNIFPSTPTSSTCTADVGDASGVSRTTPTGTVTFSTTHGTFTGGDTCTLAPVVGLGAISACTIPFLPAPGTEEGAPLPVTATYSGGAGFKTASGGTSPVAATPGVNSAEVANNGGFFSVPMVNPNYSAVTGTVTVSLAGAAAAGVTATSAASSIASGSFKVSRLGLKTVRLKLSKAGLKKLRSKHTLHAVVKVSTLDAGKRLSRTSHITLRLRKH
jgi:hypothetical protein